jgi:hypothetical protein
MPSREFFSYDVIKKASKLLRAKFHFVSLKAITHSFICILFIPLLYPKISRGRKKEVRITNNQLNESRQVSVAMVKI